MIEATFSHNIRTKSGLMIASRKGFLLYAFLISMLLVVAGSAFASEANHAGFLYGTLVDQSGATHTGFLRWESEEAYWDDTFDSRQVESLWREHIDFEALHKEKQKAYFESHGLLDRLAYALHNKNPDDDLSRLFLVRFGDLARIAIDADDNITITLNNGAQYEVAGYANDVRSDILVYTGAARPTEFAWDELAEIRFSEAPVEATPYARRLSGTVKTTRGDFTGFIMWDMSECTTIDVLNSDQEDVAMGDIKSISRTDDGHAEVTFTDGRVAVLSGSNDVDHSNRGIGIETSQFGRIYVPWRRVLSVDFANDLGSGLGRSDFGLNGTLQGRVTDLAGKIYSGRLIYDLDEAYVHDIFSGEIRGYIYEIPFALISSIEPMADETSRLTLRDGLVLELNNDQDTGQDNGGVLVFAAEEKTAQRIPWAQIVKIEFLP